MHNFEGMLQLITASTTEKLLEFKEPMDEKYVILRSMLLPRPEHLIANNLYKNK
jgi:hypothetical protein